jgi:RNA polymerase sigma factor (sigma-70 family)
MPLPNLQQKAAIMDTANQQSQSNEHLVRAMRSHWVREATLLAEQHESEAGREKAHGDRLFLALTTNNKPLLAKYARSYFDRDASLITDGVQELVVALYGELRCLTDNVHGRLWEDRFAFCLKMLAYALFTRRLQKLYGKARPAKDPDDPEAERPYFEQTHAACIPDGGDFDPIESAPDPAAREQIPQLLQRAEIRSLLSAIPNPAQREALWLSCRGWKQDRIAAHQGCSVKTVYNRIGSATAVAAEWARERYQTHGEFSDWMSGR